MIPETVIAVCQKLIQVSDAILIGAGSGLSAAAGLAYSGKRFTDNFADYIERFPLTDMYSSGFYPFPTREEKWGYFSRHIKLNRYDAEAGKVYSDLLQLVESKNYFVITTNVDAQFFKAGFAADQVFATQGDYGKFQCEKACHDTLYDNEQSINQMVTQQSDCRIPAELIPVCPVCGKNLVTHLRIDGYFVENSDWKAASRHYQDFVNAVKNQKLVLLELGVGFNTPVIIRWPFERMAKTHTQSTLIRVNKDNVHASYSEQERNILIKADIADFLERMSE
ncbi:Sir2 silent information regulator family NAD-dependent deacetylase [bacterium]|nr:Sir2 silent information regulator family NAD-dependent deacetylase [bacterium]